MRSIDQAVRADVSQHEDDFAVRLIGIRQRHDDLVGSGCRAERRHEENRPEEPHQADATGLHRDELAIGGEPSESHQDSQQHGHRDGQAERLGKQGGHRSRDDRPLHALRDEVLACNQDWGQNENEGQDRQPEREGQRDLAHEVTVQNP